MTRDAIQQNSRDVNTNPPTNTPNVLQSRPPSGAAIMRPEGMYPPRTLTLLFLDVVPAVPACILRYLSVIQCINYITMYSLRYYIDSWIEVSSQPSSSSLSSTTTNDDIITTGLRVQQTEPGPYQHRSRRRRLQNLASGPTAQVDYSPRETGSSQDEYEESESESDRVLSSSNEDMSRPPLGHRLQTAPPSFASEVAASSDDDDASTALGLRISSSPFVPQPNAFSHPPATQDPSWTRAIEPHRSHPNMVPKPTRRTATRRNSMASTRPRRQQQHSPYNMISPSHHADHDAALRASLSTLLSCAAAARGLPKSEPQPARDVPSNMQPSTFRFVPESVAMGDESEGDNQSCTEATAAARVQQPSSMQSAGSYPTVTAGPTSRTKRRSGSSKDRNSQRQSVPRKSRRTSLSEPSTPASPTIMTWVISAGVVVIFSAISFSAGYMLGREVGKTETGGFGSVFGDGSNGRCGRETVKGSLKRLRWGTAAAGSGIMS